MLNIEHRIGRSGQKSFQDLTGEQDRDLLIRIIEEPEND